jgi:uncharacterized membrane protein
MASQIPGQGGTNLGVAPNVGGVLCYAPCCIGLIFSIVAVIVEKQSRFVRFHAFQALLLYAAFVVVGLGLGIVMTALEFAIGGLGMGLMILGVRVIIGFGGLALCIYMMIQAYGGKETSLPVIGDMARKWA